MAVTSKFNLYFYQTNSDTIRKNIPSVQILEFNGTGILLFFYFVVDEVEEVEEVDGEEDEEVDALEDSSAAFSACCFK